MKLSEVIEKYGDCEVSEELLKMVKPKGDWKPKKGDKYYFITTVLEIGSEIFYNYEWENNHLSKRNCYQTEEEAQFALEMYYFCKERSFEPDWEDNSQKKHSICLDYASRLATNGFNYVSNKFCSFYYPTIEAVQEVIDKYSFDELAKYYGRV